MDNIEIIIWLFPIIFMIHEFEEIVFFKIWLSKNQALIQSRFPKLAHKVKIFNEEIETAAFSLAIAEQFVIVSIVTITAYLNEWYYLWIGLFIAFTIHLLIHIIQFIVVRRYIPVIITSLGIFPISTYIIYIILPLFQINSIIIYSVIGTILMVININLIHKGMFIFNRWLIKQK